MHIKKEKSQEFRHKDGRCHHRDQLPGQRDNENSDTFRGAQRQRRKPCPDTENDPIKEIDTIIRVLHVGGKSRNSQ